MSYASRYDREPDLYLKLTSVWPDPPEKMEARRLDRLADFELQLGHVAVAERLSHRAADLRGGV